MNRREALKKMGLITGGTIFGTQVLLMGCKPGSGILTDTFTPKNLMLLNQIGETIIPKTDTPGAAEADVASFMKKMVTDFYTENEQQVFAIGLNRLRKTSQEQFGGEFAGLSTEKRRQLLHEFESEIERTEENASFYLMVKQLTVWGFLTSEVAAKQIFEHVPVPGRYDGCVDFGDASKAAFPEISQWQALEFA